MLCDEDVAFVGACLDRNLEFADAWPVNQLLALVEHILADGVFTPDERMLLFHFLEGIAVTPETQDRPATNIFDFPQVVKFSGKSFLFTGTLHMGTRKQAQESVVRLGGTTLKGARTGRTAGTDGRSRRCSTTGSDAAQPPSSSTRPRSFVRSSSAARTPCTHPCVQSR